MFTRQLPLPARSFFLLGPRATGKTTWLRQKLPRARWYNLLLHSEWSRLLQSPAVFREEVAGLPAGSWVVVDEVQRLPALLDEVHELLSQHPTRVHFALTGSSARKLRRDQANLLAGRALSRRFFPLTASELGSARPVEELLRFGGLPGIHAEPDLRVRVDLLRAYRDTYLAEEIRNEGLVRSLDGFSRFLEVAALRNAQVINTASTARDAGVSRTTVQGYFEVLVDTMLGVLLPAWRARARVRETAHPKFYLFDTGVTRTLAGQAGAELAAAERGHLLETWVLHELRAHAQLAGLDGELSYWRTRDGLEVDFVWQQANRRVGVEVKATTRFRPEETRGLKALRDEVGLDRAVVVYLGEHRLRHEDIEVLPFDEFTREVGAVLGT